MKRLELGGKLDPTLKEKVNDILSAMEEEYSKSRAQDAGDAAGSKSSFIDTCLSAAKIGVGSCIDKVKLGFVLMQLHHKRLIAEGEDQERIDEHISMVDKIISFVEGCANSSVIFDDQSKSFKTLETCVEEHNKEKGTSLSLEMTMNEEHENYGKSIKDLRQEAFSAIGATRPEDAGIRVKHISDQVEDMLQFVYNLLPEGAIHKIDMSYMECSSIKYGSKEFEAAKEYLKQLFIK